MKIVRRRKPEWNDHIRIDDDRIVRIARNKSPNGRRSIGSPRKDGAITYKTQEANIEEKTRLRIDPTYWKREEDNVC